MWVWMEMSRVGQDCPWELVGFGTGCAEAPVPAVLLRRAVLLVEGGQDTHVARGGGLCVAPCLSGAKPAVQARWGRAMDVGPRFQPSRVCA